MAPEMRQARLRQARQEAENTKGETDEPPNAVTGNPQQPAKTIVSETVDSDGQGDEEDISPDHAGKNDVTPDTLQDEEEDNMQNVI